MEEKKMFRKLPVILTVVMLGAILLVACSPAAPAAPAAATEMPKTPSPVICSDPGCFQPQFLACVSSVMTIPFTGESFLKITVFGQENGLCHYAGAVVDKNGNTVAGGPPSADCRVPIEKITKDTFGHFFGQNTTPSIKAEQDKIDNDYCVKK
jgi:hypothetical protein